MRHVRAAHAFQAATAPAKLGQTLQIGFTRRGAAGANAVCDGFQDGGHAALL